MKHEKNQEQDTRGDGQVSPNLALEGLQEKLMATRSLLETWSFKSLSLRASCRPLVLRGKKVSEEQNA